ncbi:MAG: hypothetical protein RLN86_08410 [Cyclobacteriaceae bacterium]
MRSVLLVILLFQFGCALGQSQEEKVKEFEMQRQAADQRQITAQLDSAIYLTENGQYILADEKFKSLLKIMKSVPSDMVYYFGQNSYHIGKYKQSVDWLNKYIQLKGTTGQFSEAAIEWKQKAEAEIMKEKQVQSQQAAQVLSKDYFIDCGPAGKVTCPVCQGSTVIIKRGYTGETYRTCPYCSKHGFLSCEDYNKLLRGQLEPSVAND